MDKGLRQSQKIFNGKFGVPADRNYYEWFSDSRGVNLPMPPGLASWNPKGKPSNCPNLSAVVEHYARHCPWQLRSVIKSTFVGRVDRVIPNAEASGAFGEQPCIAVYDGLYLALDQCIVLWEKVNRAYATLVQYRGIRGRTDEDVKDAVSKELGKREVADCIEKTHKLRNFLLSGDPCYIRDCGPSGFEMKEDGVPKVDLSHRRTRLQVTESFIVAHELAHILLGHCSSNLLPAAAVQFLEREIPVLEGLAQYGSMDSQSQEDEAHADMVGFYTLLFSTYLRYTLESGAPVEFGKDRASLSILFQCLDGSAIACLAIHLVSTLGIAPTNDSTHPHPDRRMDVLLAMTQSHVEATISASSESDIGPNGPGFFDRAMWGAHQVRTVYKMCQTILGD